MKQHTNNSLLKIQNDSATKKRFQNDSTTKKFENIQLKNHRSIRSTNTILVVDKQATKGDRGKLTKNKKQRVYTKQVKQITLHKNDIKILPRLFQFSSPKKLSSPSPPPPPPLHQPPPKPPASPPSKLLPLLRFLRLFVGEMQSLLLLVDRDEMVLWWIPLLALAYAWCANIPHIPAVHTPTTTYCGTRTYPCNESMFYPNVFNLYNPNILTKYNTNKYYTNNFLCQFNTQKQFLRKPANQSFNQNKNILIIFFSLTLRCGLVCPLNLYAFTPKVWPLLIDQEF
eukprot:TRINITY_DN2321_c0_g1_i1.p1 TRINITY_DN2321_c0_g1~~TRINITY_DN2321_c0_g1_i1.p1  ORF type:complete len:284 (+),score=15.18 TRINITY_DN2321_c0_g1_i1:185-1036(+)